MATRCLFTFDIFHCPDFKSLFGPHVDPNFANYSKEETTQLAWKFEAVVRSQYFPLGVRAMYRAYAGGTIYELQYDCINSTIPEVPYLAAKVHCEKQPIMQGQSGLGVLVDGMSIL